MKTLNPALLLLCVFTTIFVSCGKTDDNLEEAYKIDPCLDLGSSSMKLEILEEYTALPGKVSVFFKATDKQGGPVPGLSASNFTIYEKGRNDLCFEPISDTESNARIGSKEQLFNQYTLLVLDLSNSVLKNSLQELKQASIGFINNVMPFYAEPSSQMAIVWFDGEDTLHILQEMTQNKQLLIGAVESIDENISRDPSTDLYGAVIRATAMADALVVSGREKNVVTAASVVVFTDGTDQAARYSRDEALNTVNKADENISFYTIGLGEEIDQAVLNAIGKTSSVFASDKEELENTFNQISAAVGGHARSYYLFEYCSPKRDGSGINQLVIHARNGELSGAVQTSFDATGFTSGCE